MPEELVHLLDIIVAVIEILGMSVLLTGFLISSWRYLRHRRQMTKPDLFQEFRRGLGRTVLVGLEILVAATIVKTVSVKPTLVSVGLLAGMIAMRTILDWTMALEMDGHWLWQPGARVRDRPSNGG